MDMSKFKVGDLVTPDEEALIAGKIRRSDATYRSLGEVFTVVSVTDDSIDFDRGVCDAGRHGWMDRYYKLAKKEFVLKIINDL